MATFTGELPSRWSDLPSDVIVSIADRLDEKIGILRLRAVCKSWRSSLCTLPSAIKFPLKLPFLPFSPPSTSTSLSSLPHPTHLSLFQRTVYLLSPLSDPSNGGFLLKVQETENNPDTFSLFSPLLSFSNLSTPRFPINLLDYRISLVCKTYGFESQDISIKKVVVATDFFESGDFVVLGLNFSKNLVLWRFGDENWTDIAANGRCFDDVISYNGKFYATADRKGRLVMIDSRLKPIDLVPKLMFGDGKFTYLVECDGGLYLIDRVIDGDPISKFGVFKLDDKGRFWDYELDLNDCVFFVGDGASFSLSRNDYNGAVKNVIFFFDYDEFGAFTRVFDVRTSTSSLCVESESYGKLLWPPLSWFNLSAAQRLR